MAQAKKHRKRKISLVPSEDLPEVFRALVLQSPISTWIADKDGTLIFENEANRKLFGIERDEEVVGKYNIFKDNVLIEGGYMPPIRKIFEEGGSIELVVDYDFSRVRHVKVSHPTHKILRAFLFAVKDEAGKVRYVVVQHEDYTEKWQAEKALRESEERYRKLVENLSDWVWAVDLEGRYTYSGPPVETILGYRVDEIIGKSCFDIIIAEDREWIRQVFREAVRNRAEIHMLTKRTMRKDGSICYLECQAKPAFDEHGHLTSYRGIDRDVTERVRAEEALRESERRYRTLIETSPDAIAVIDVNDRIVIANPQAAMLYGAESEEEILGRSVLDFITPEDRRRTEEYIRRALEAGGIGSFETAVLRKDGTRLPVEVNASAFLDREGRPTAAIAVMRDITERKRTEEERERLLHEMGERIKELRCLYGIAESVRQRETLEAVFQDVAELIPPAWQYPEITRARVCFDRKEYVSLEFEESKWKQSSDIIVAGEQRGVVEVYYVEARPTSHEGPFLKEERQLIDGIAHTLSEAIERKWAEEALCESESRYRDLVESMMEGLARADADYVFTYVNKCFADMLGRPPEEIVGHSLMEFVHEDYHDFMVDQIARRKRGEAGRYELAWRSKDGSKVYTLVSPKSILDEKGNFLGSTAVLTNITDRKQAEEALGRSEANFRTIFDYMPGATFAYDRHAVILQANPACERLVGFTREQMVGRSVFETFARLEDRQKREEVVARVFAGETVEGIEWQDVRADGTTVYVLTNSTPVYDPTGQVSMGLSLGVDVTERKLAEQRRRELEEHKRDFYRRTILAATEGKLVISEREEIEGIAGPPITSWDIKRAEDVGALRDAVSQLARSAGMEENRIFDLALAVGEATTNAFKHAGGGTASLHSLPEGLLFMVSDRGPGIEALTLPEVALVRGYSTAGSLGMGYKAILSVADKVYLATGPTGTTVAIEMRLRAAEMPVSVAGLPDTWTG